MYRLLNVLKADAAVESCYPFGQYHHVVLKEDGGKEMLEQLLHREGMADGEVKAIPPGIEDCFMRLMH